MDNFSHTVTGLVAGALIHRSIAEESDIKQQQLRQRLIGVACCAASNFPDLDLVFTHLLPAPLGYLLHHRGHTHTILALLPQALILVLLIWLCWPAAHHLLRRSTTARQGLAWALLTGLSLHLAMDYLNSYGIHPFYPWDARWFYGDLVFILEPLFWVAFGIPLALRVKPAWLKSLLVMTLLGVPLYFTIQAYLSWPSLVALVLIACAVGYAQYRAGTEGREGMVSAALILLLFIGIQNVASRQARDVIASELHGLDPASRLLDIALTPFPSNPVCWSFASIESNEAVQTYRVRRGVISLSRDRLPVQSCPSSLSEQSVQGHAGNFIIHYSENTGDLQQLRHLHKSNCFVQAWMRFARIPFVEHDVATDMRFASNSRNNFTAMDLEAVADQVCPQGVPAWAYPRTDLLMP